MKLSLVLALSSASVLPVVARAQEPSPGADQAAPPSASTSAPDAATPSAAPSRAAPPVRPPAAAVALPEIAPAEPKASAFAATGGAFELGTGGLAGMLDGALGVGWQASTLTLGLAVDFRYTSLTEQMTLTPSRMVERTLAVGPWFRFPLARTFDGRVELVGAVDLQVVSRAVTRNDGGPSGDDVTAWGVSARVGPGLRFWAHPHIALGYTTQWSFTRLSGPSLAFSSAVPPGISDEQVQVDTGFVGRFTFLAVF
jgi:hypothetical protein